MEVQTQSKGERLTTIFFKIFFIGLLLQFFLQTFVMFKLGLRGGIWDAIWMWKELVILIGFVFAIYLLIKQKISLKNLQIKRYIIVLFISLLLVFVISLFVTNSGISNTLMSVRYNFTGFFILPISFVISYFYYKNKSFDIFQRYNKVLKILIVSSFFWWLVILLAPGILHRLGYNMMIHEGEVGSSPPAVYHTQLYEGYVRNQFLFERPIGRGFFLVAFWPMFFLFNIKQKGRKNTLFWGALFGLAVLLTFSRAARGAWFLQTGILILTQYGKKIRKIILIGFLPFLVLFGLVIWLGKDQIIHRDFSNTGHLEFTVEAIKKATEKPLFGRGAGSAGPVTHQNGGEGYNPENQYLQIILEYGIIGFLGRFILYLYLHFIGFKTIFQEERKLGKQEKIVKSLLFCLSLGVLGLSIEGLVLHSFIDRMIVYPFMAIFGIALAVYFKSYKSL